VKAQTYQGKVCPKHPELKGERHRSTRHCPKCKREYTLRWRAKNRERYLESKRRYRDGPEPAPEGARRGLASVTTAGLQHAWWGSLPLNHPKGD